jgi:hypothetical protein
MFTHNPRGDLVLNTKKEF